MKKTFVKINRNSMISRLDRILTQLGTNNSSQIATAVLAGFKMIFLPVATATDKTATPDQKKYTIIRDIIMEGLALGTYIGVTGQIQKHATSPICSMYYKSKAKKIEAGKIVPVEALTQDEIAFLKNVDSKKIKEAGNDFLTRISSKHKVMSDDTRSYIEKLNGIINKINGENAETVKVSLDEYISTELNAKNKVKEAASSLFKDMKNAAKDSPKLLKPLKVFQNTRIALSQLSVWALALVIIPPMCNAIIGPMMKSFGKKVNQKPETSEMPSVTSFAVMNDKLPKRNFNDFYRYFPNTTGMRV